MAVAEWTEAMDTALKHQRLTQKLAWRLVRIEGATKRECQKRLEWLTSGKAAAVVKVAKASDAEGVDAAKDGLLWLIRKRRLSPQRQKAAIYYRDQGRLADAGGGALKSCLGTAGEGGGGASGARDVGDLPLALGVDAKRQVFQMRFVALGGQRDLLTVMDGVCIRGHTLVALAGDRRRAAELEALFNVACDLISAWRLGSAGQQAGEKAA